VNRHARSGSLSAMTRTLQAPPSALAPDRPITVRIARWSATHPWRAIAMWLVFVTASIAIGQAAGLHEVSNRDLAIGQSGRADQMLHDAGLAEPAIENVLITARSGALDPSTARVTAAGVTNQMRALPEVAGVAAPVPSHDGRAVLVKVTLRGDPEKAGEHVGALLTATAAVARAHPTVRVEEVGSASMDQAVK
jgi:RND superfamily putative drug exporter